MFQACLSLTEINKLHITRLLKALHLHDKIFMNKTKHCLLKINKETIEIF